MENKCNFSVTSTLKTKTTKIVCNTRNAANMNLVAEWKRSSFMIKVLTIGIG